MFLQYTSSCTLVLRFLSSKKIIKSPKINVTLHTLIIDMKLLTTTADACLFFMFFMLVFLIETFLERISSKSRAHGFIYALQSVL